MMRSDNFGDKRSEQPPREISNPRGYRPPPPPSQIEDSPPPQKRDSQSPPPQRGDSSSPPAGYNYNGGYHRNRGGCLGRIFVVIAVAAVILAVVGISVCSRGEHSRAAGYDAAEFFSEEFRDSASADK